MSKWNFKYKRNNSQVGWSNSCELVHADTAEEALEKYLKQAGWSNVDADNPEVIVYEEIYFTPKKKKTVLERIGYEKV